MFFPDYEPEVDDLTVDRLDLETPDDALVLAVVTFGDKPEEATANLMAPIVINRYTREAAQIVLLPGTGDPEAYPLHAPLLVR